MKFFNNDYLTLSKEELNIFTLCLSMINDLMRNFIVDHEEVKPITVQLRTIFNSIDLLKADNSLFIDTYLTFICNVRFILEDLETDRIKYNFVRIGISEEEQMIYLKFKNLY